MGTDQPRWYGVGKRAKRVKGGGDHTDERATETLSTEDETPIAPSSSVPDSGGALVARSQIVVAGSTVTLTGTMTNETGSDVHFSGMPPYARTLDTDGSRSVLLGDFNSPPREQPSCSDWVMHPGASVPYRSLPVTLQTPGPRWDGTEWSASSRSTRLDVMTFRSGGMLTTIQIIS
ncbi:MAG: hypothetical protein ABI662_08640 [Dermatophilaceae bacterium]